MPLMITDTRDQYYRLSSLNFTANLDIIRLGSFSLMAYGGGFLNYSRGLLGTGGWPEIGALDSEYFFRLYYGGTFGGGLRYNSPDKLIGFEVLPFNFQFGPDYYFTAYISVGMHINILKD